MGASGDNSWIKREVYYWPSLIGKKAPKGQYHISGNALVYDVYTVENCRGIQNLSRLQQ